MPNSVSYTVRKGSKNWVAFFNGKISAEELVNRQVTIPVAEEINIELDDTADLMVKLYNDTIDGWDHRPKFIARRIKKMEDDLDGKVSLSVSVSGEHADNWKRINDGVAKHSVASTKHRGNFAPIPMPMRRYTRHTSAGIGLPKSRAGAGNHGAPRGFAFSVTNKHIKARHFTDRIVKYMTNDPQNAFSRRISNALRRASRRIARNG